MATPSREASPWSSLRHLSQEFRSLPRLLRSFPAKLQRHSGTSAAAHAPQKPKQRISKDATVTILDWDDALLPKSWLERSRPIGLQAPTSLAGAFVAAGGRPSDDLLPRIDAVAQHLLSAAVRQGRTFIVTNASSGWVEESAAKYLPGLASLLPQVTVVSAKSPYEDQDPEQAGLWKVQAFLEIAKECDFRSIRDVIIVGDGQLAMSAADVVESRFADLQIKVVRLQEEPSASDLLKQLQLVLDNFKQFVSVEKSINITLERSLRRIQGDHTERES